MSAWSDVINKKVYIKNPAPMRNHHIYHITQGVTIWKCNFQICCAIIQKINICMKNVTNSNCSRHFWHTHLQISSRVFLQYIQDLISLNVLTQIHGKTPTLGGKAMRLGRGYRHYSLFKWHTQTCGACNNILKEN